MVNFIVNGPFDVPSGREGPNGAYFVDEKRLKDLIQSSEETICKAGCYVFAGTSSRGSIRSTSGKPREAILEEAFNDRNVKNLNRYMNGRRRGSFRYTQCIRKNASWRRQQRSDFGNRRILQWTRLASKS